jgi:hypothetical protein
MTTICDPLLEGHFVGLVPILSVIMSLLLVTLTSVFFVDSISKCVGSSRFAIPQFFHTIFGFSGLAEIHTAHVSGDDGGGGRKLGVGPMNITNHCPELYVSQL